MILLDICELIVDCPHSTAKDEGHGFPLIRTPNIGKGRLILDNVHRVCKEVYDKRNIRAIPQVNDIILAREAPAGNVALITKGQKVCLGQRTVLIRPNINKVNPEYLVYYMLSPKVQHDLQSSANGATVAHINMPKIRNLKIQIPNRVIQDKIATILSRYDALIENYQKQIKLLEESAQRLYKEWFVDLRFPGHENTKIVDGVPEGWEKKKLIDFTHIVMGQSPKSEFYNNDKMGLPFHQGVGSFGSRFVVDNVYSSCFTKIAESNSILFSVRAPVGRINITNNKVAIGRGLASINHKKGFQSFLYYLLKSFFFEENIIGNGAIFASISKDDLYNLLFLIPDEKLVMDFNKVVSEIDGKIKNISKQIHKLTEARDRLLPKLMSGEIEV